MEEVEKAEDEEEKAEDEEEATEEEEEDQMKMSMKRDEYLSDLPLG